jgi:hypothetical protein
MWSAIKAIARKVNPGLVLSVCYVGSSITLFEASPLRGSVYDYVVFALVIMLAGYGFSFRRKENLPAMTRYDWLVVVVGAVVFIVHIGMYP